MHASRIMIIMSLAVCARVAMADEVPTAPPANNAEVRNACEADAAKLCAGIQPGGGRIARCLAEHKSEVSDMCKQAIAKARQGKS